jgi:hypothetical protein
MEYTTAQIAVMTGRSERQVQRWLKDGKLPAQHRYGSVYEVDEHDLEPFLPRTITDSLVERIERIDDKVWRHDDAISTLQMNRQSMETSINEWQHSLHEALRSIEALEVRVSELEGKLQERPLTTLRPAPAPYVTSSPGQASTLPGDLVPLHLFYHGIPPSTVKRRIRDGLLPAIEGEWKQGNHVIKFALDAEGRRRFYEMFQTDTGHFIVCDQCPHELP